MRFLDRFKYEKNPELSAHSAELLNDKKWRTRQSIWLVMPILFGLGLFSWAFLLFQGFTHKSQLAKNLGYVHLALFILMTLLGDGSAAGGVSLAVATTGIGFPLYVRKDILIRRAMAKKPGAVWLEENAPGATVTLDKTLAEVRRTYDATKSQISKEVEALQAELDTTKDEAQRSLEERKTSAQELKRAQEARRLQAKESEVASNDLRADGRTKGPRKLDF